MISDSDYNFVLRNLEYINKQYFETIEIDFYRANKLYLMRFAIEKNNNFYIPPKNIKLDGIEEDYCIKNTDNIHWASAFWSIDFSEDSLNKLVDKFGKQIIELIGDHQLVTPNFIRRNIKLIDSTHAKYSIADFRINEPVDVFLEFLEVFGPLTHLLLQRKLFKDEEQLVYLLTEVNKTFRFSDINKVIFHHSQYVTYSFCPIIQTYVLKLNPSFKFYSLTEEAKQFLKVATL